MAQIGWQFRAALLAALSVALLLHAGSNCAGGHHLDTRAPQPAVVAVPAASPASAGAAHAVDAHGSHAGCISAETAGVDLPGVVLALLVLPLAGIRRLTTRLVPIRPQTPVAEHVVDRS